MSARPVDGADGDGDSETLQSRLEVADAGDSDSKRKGHAGATIADPAALLLYLDVSGHFHRDGRAGRVFHRGMVSLRENVATDSLHVSVQDNRVTAHVDEVSPLDVESRGSSGYSIRRAVTHNLAGMAQDLVSLLRGRQGDHSCVLNCEWVSSETQSAPAATRLLDSQAAAWSVQLEARVTGSLDESRLRTALGAALADTLERDPLEVIDCPDDDALDAARVRLQSTAIAVTERPPLHVYLARHPDGDFLMLNLNHAASDGFGALHVLRSIARAYTGDADPEPALDFLALRDLPVRPASPPTSVVVRFYNRAVEWLRDTLARPALLAADGPEDTAGYGFHLVGLSADETRDMIGVAREGASSDVLMAALHLTIGDWNRQHDAPDQQIGVLAPANLCPADWPQNTIGNFSITARVSTSRRDRSRAASALKAVSAQTSRNKRARTGIALIAGLERAGLLALWAKQSSVVLQPLTGNLVDSAMLCNLGVIDEAPSFGSHGGETLEVWFSMPARSPTILCVGAVMIGGGLQLTFRYPRRVLGPDAARRFAESYLEHVRVVAGQSSPLPRTRVRAARDFLERNVIAFVAVVLASVGLLVAAKRVGLAQGGRPRRGARGSSARRPARPRVRRASGR